ncbi:uncharacterized protein SPAPADRAFT_58408 [Spathaspora passalidarum NRRL Y-27907]|uniref:HTH La-type RNA-binding domain-containing protein n=1 Tax=Spathaspora passalidarum (strain NRRL Y-27907 / 11-Y1) TaxID=619300 RepID=G3AG69_SPAPN|nr:uncharacterized protein SPAPADRAFT_58408 [Spathaspora passalidarum NRRL Y-27907]EGW35208.1 hypothetical protein SPAPADRAFT_58408 [Spathaspora passalidarum NRRL Y-27907]
MSDFVYQGEDFDEKVRKQVEFYFSDSNLQTDKFLWKIYQANEGWVELKTILTFGRMRQYRPEEKVIAALKESSQLVLSESGDMIKRKEPVKDLDEIKNTRKKNTIHIEGFPKDATQEDLESWFQEKIVVSLPKEQGISSLRRIKSRAKKEFFGVVDVELKTLEDAEYLLNEVELAYPQGIVTATEEEDKKNLLKKMSLLRFQEMRESAKRFGVNEVTKRRNSFNDNQKGKKFGKNFKGKREPRETTEETKLEKVVESEPAAEAEKVAEKTSEEAIAKEESKPAEPEA